MTSNPPFEPNDFLTDEMIRRYNDRKAALAQGQSLGAFGEQWLGPFDPDQGSGSDAIAADRPGGLLSPEEMMAKMQAQSLGSRVPPYVQEFVPPPHNEFSIWWQMARAGGFRNWYATNFPDFLADHERPLPPIEPELIDHFPEVDPPLKPMGGRVVIQLRRPITKTRGGIILPEDVRQTDQDNTEVGRVIDYGPTAYINKTFMLPWPEGVWAHRGEYVKVMKYGGYRKTVKLANGDTVEFVEVNDGEILGKVTGDPADVTAYVPKLSTVEKVLNG